MSHTAPQQPVFQLSNGADRPPRVHSLFVPSTSTWQYVVADPSTLRCVVIDPVRDRNPDGAALSLSAADAIFALVREHGYIVDHICETSSRNGHLSAAWFLRMQFADVQGWAPHLSNEAAVSAMENMWHKRHGASTQFCTNLSASLADGQAVLIGRMRMTCLHLPGLGAPNRRGFLMGENLFGAHSLAALSSQSLPKDDMESISAATDADMYSQTTKSMQRVLSLPGHIRAYFDLGEVGAEREDPFGDIQCCRVANEYVGLSVADFRTRWEGQRRSRQREQSREGELKPGTTKRSWFRR